MKGAVFHVRMPEEDRDAFHARAKALSVEPAEFAREVLKAAAEGRITIVPSQNQRKLHAELYKL